MATHRLNVFLYGELIGTLSGSGTLLREFRYLRTYEGAALSDSLPISLRRSNGPLTSAWFGGLLPEGAELRSAMAEAHGSRDTSSMGLLKVAGLDCAGAVQFTEDDNLPMRIGESEQITEDQIGARLDAANSGLPVSDAGEHWSVAGQQGKLALHLLPDGSWARALNGLPTTHILKPGIPSIGRQMIEDQALTEHLTLSAAQRLGLIAAPTRFQIFGGTPAVVVTRYDRLLVEGEWLRLHQEDLCQALGIPPERKYEDQGGPGVAQIAQFLDEKADSPGQSKASRLTFAGMVMFNYLSGSPDAHSKNYSVLRLPDGQTRLAPMYDAASGLGYSHVDTGKMRFTRAAMKIGHRNQFGRVTEDDWKQFSKDLSLPHDDITEMRRYMTLNLPEVFRAQLDVGIPAEAKARILSSPLLARMTELCESAAVEPPKMATSIGTSSAQRNDHSLE